MVRCGRAWFDVVQWLGVILDICGLLWIRVWVRQRAFKEPMHFHFLEIQDALRFMLPPNTP